MTFELMRLPYENDALAPFLSAETLEFHYGKHHRGYVDTLNELVEGTPAAGLTLTEIVKTRSGELFENAAQVFNHDLYWQSLRPGGSEAVPQDLHWAIDSRFGSFDDFKRRFTDLAKSHFGSGWAWLVDRDGELDIKTTHDADCPIADGEAPLLNCDLWEHAYYIDYRNDRGAYLDAWWKSVDWNFALQNLARARKSG